MSDVWNCAISSCGCLIGFVSCFTKSYQNELFNTEFGLFSIEMGEMKTYRLYMTSSNFGYSKHERVLYTKWWFSKYIEWSKGSFCKNYQTQYITQWKPDDICCASPIIRKSNIFLVSFYDFAKVFDFKANCWTSTKLNNLSNRIHVQQGFLCTMPVSQDFAWMGLDKINNSWCTI